MSVTPKKYKASRDEAFYIACRFDNLREFLNKHVPEGTHHDRMLAALKEAYIAANEAIAEEQAGYVKSLRQKTQRLLEA